MFKAIFFDLDETIIDAIAPHIKAEKEVFEKFSINYEDIKKRTRQHDFTGMRIIDILKIERDAIHISEKQLPLSELASQRQKIFLDLVKKESKLFAGAKEALKLAKEKGAIVAIVSSGTRKYIQLVINIFALREYIDYFVGEEDVEKGKPAPDCYLKAYELLPKKKLIAKEECLVIEDSVKGVRAANTAGLPVCYIPFSPTKEKVTFMFKLKNLKEFPTLFCPTGKNTS